MDLNKVVAGSFFLILVFLVVSRANEVNLLVSTIGGFVTRYTQTLQGVSSSGNLIQSSNFTPQDAQSSGFLGLFG